MQERGRVTVEMNRLGGVQFSIFSAMLTWISFYFSSHWKYWLVGVAILELNRALFFRHDFYLPAINSNADTTFRAAVQNQYRFGCSLTSLKPGLSLLPTMT
uniref:Uncharacterized protein n=1 Tax=Oryza punctata TaxID=4537 RepID=A0A0E0KGF3_ORYPU